VLKSHEAIPLGDGYIATVGQWEQSFVDDAGREQTAQVRTTETRIQTLYVVDPASIGTPPPPRADGSVQ
jgi:hypothetical protein